VDIYVYMQGQRRGPYEKVQLETMWKRDQIPVDTMYWHDGMSKWAVISDLFAGGKTIPSSLPEDAANAGTTTFPAPL
jgi:GYF domain 2